MEKHIQKYFITVITPTILRPELKLLCDYIDNANRELGNIQHLVMVDKEILTEEDEQLLSSIRNKDREINMVFKEKSYNDYGNLARVTAYPFIKGKYVINIDDDDIPINDLFNKFCELLIIHNERHSLIIFPALRGGVRFFNIPAGKCKTVSCQYFYKPIINKKEMKWLSGNNYDLDGDFLEMIMGETTPFYWETEKPLVKVDFISRGERKITKL